MKALNEVNRSNRKKWLIIGKLTDCPYKGQIDFHTLTVYRN